jgi:hypothetical protein
MTYRLGIYVALMLFYGSVATLAQRTAQPGPTASITHMRDCPGQAGAVHLCAFSRNFLGATIG